MVGCQKATSKKIEDTTTIVISYGIKSYAAVIKDQEEIAQIEELFNNAKFELVDGSIQHSFLFISFQGEKGTVSFTIDEENIIKIMDGDDSHFVSKDITFDKLYSIYEDYLKRRK